MEDTIDTIRTLSVGGLALTVRIVADYYPDTSDIGKPATLREAIDKGEWIYDRETRLLAGPSVPWNGYYVRQWRDARGRIVTTVDPDDWSREYRFIIPTVWEGEGAKQARSSAEHLDGFYRDQWQYVGIVATVTLDGVEIGSASVWGCEASWNTDYRKEYGNYIRIMAREALEHAKAFRSRLAKVAS